MLDGKIETMGRRSKKNPDAGAQGLFIPDDEGPEEIDLHPPTIPGLDKVVSDH